MLNVCVYLIFYGVGLELVVGDVYMGWRYVCMDVCLSCIV